MRPPRWALTCAPSYSKPIQQTQSFPCTNHDRQGQIPVLIRRRHITISSQITSTDSSSAIPSFRLDAAANTSEPLPTPIRRTSVLQPRTHKPPEDRKSQLHRQYTSILQGTPLILLLQHNNLKTNEWAALRRELDVALLRDARKNPEGEEMRMWDEGRKPRVVVVRTGVFAASLRVVEHYLPLFRAGGRKAGDSPKHLLSEEAYRATVYRRKEDGAPRKRWTSLEPLLMGPIALVTFPMLSPAQLATVLRIMAPKAPAFAAPKRKEQPGLYDGSVQSGLEKLLLLGARVDEGTGTTKSMDHEGVRYVGSLAARGGLEGLRAEVLGLLQGAGMSLTGALESGGRSLWATIEGRRMDLEGERKE